MLKKMKSFLFPECIIFAPNKSSFHVVEAIAPIFSNEIIIGYMMFGQIIENNASDVYEKVNMVSKQFNIKITDKVL